jgi:hypothetical protein
MDGISSIANQKVSERALNKDKKDPNITNDISSPVTQSEAAALKEVLDSSGLQAVLSKQLNTGDSVAISLGDKQVVTIKRVGVSRLQRLREFGAMAADNASDVIKQDPAFAFKTSAMLAKEQVLAGLPANIAPICEQGFLPLLRVVSVVLDGKRLKETMRSTRANGNDKVISIAHVGTDVLGLAGAGMSLLPSLPAALITVGGILTAAGILGDIGAFGYNIMRYFENKGVPIPDPTNPTPTPPPADPSTPPPADPTAPPASS